MIMEVNNMFVGKDKCEYCKKNIKGKKTVWIQTSKQFCTYTCAVKERKRRSRKKHGNRKSKF